jgi:hypothetical protein
VAVKGELVNTYYSRAELKTTFQNLFPFYLLSLLSRDLMLDWDLMLNGNLMLLSLRLTLSLK